MRCLMAVALLVLASILVPPVARAESGQVGSAGEPVEVTAPAEDAPKARERAHCIRESGTRIRHHSRRECERPGRRYTREDIRRRGEIDLGEALYKLDPAIDGGKRW